MRLVVFKESDEKARIGELASDGNTVFPLDIHGEIESEGILVALDEAGAERRLVRTTEETSLDQVTLLAPIPRPRRNIFCVGKNYHAHVKEMARSGYDTSVTAEAPPECPIIFSKLPESVIGSGQPIVQDASVSVETDYEAELAIIIGRGGCNIAKAHALEHIWGYTAINDVTARDVQKRHKQWLLGKSLDTFCPMGPYFVTSDSLDITDARISCWVNGELRQRASTAQMIFDVATLIATISNGITLLPGDIIATGTPSGVGAGFHPPRWLVPGDTVKIEISGIGILENTVSARS